LEIVRSQLTRAALDREVAVLEEWAAKVTAWVEQLRSYIDQPGQTPPAAPVQQIGKIWEAVSDHWEMRRPDPGTVEHTYCRQFYDATRACFEGIAAADGGLNK